MISVLLSVLLCCAMLPVASAGILPQEETADFSLETVAAYESWSAAMLLRCLLYTSIPTQDERNTAKRVGNVSPSNRESIPQRR